MYIKINWMEGLEFDHINTPEGSSISILCARNLCYVSVFIPTTLSQTGFFFGNTLSVRAELQIRGPIPAEASVRWGSLHDSGYNFHLEISIERQRQVFEEYFVPDPLFDFCTLNCQGTLAVWNCFLQCPRLLLLLRAAIQSLKLCV